MEKNQHGIDTWGERGDDTIGNKFCLGRFQAQPKWEIPA